MAAPTDDAFSSCSVSYCNPEQSAHRQGGLELGKARRVERSLVWAGGRAGEAAPAVVRSGQPDVDLFPGALAHVVDIRQPGPRLDGEGIGVAQAQRPDRLVIADRRAEE